MSIIDKSGQNSSLPVISLLYIDHGWEADSKASNFRHKHDYWQLEVVTNGNIDIVIKDKVNRIGGGFSCLIPPETYHSIIYNKPRETWSIKFAADNFAGNFEGLILPDDTLGVREYCEMFINILNRHQKVVPAVYPVIRYWLAGLLSLCYESQNYPQQPDWLTEIRDNIILNSGRYESLDDLAKVTKYSRIYLSALFKQHIGMNLKQFVDSERAVIAKRQLLYSNKNITQVAESMGFADVFSFSRFFKRVTGSSPTCFLESCNE